MPRAFLITNRRYNSVVEYEDNCSAREASPERSVCTAEGPEEDDDDQTYQTSAPLKPASPRSPASLSRGLDFIPFPEESPSPYIIYGQVEPLGLTVERTNREDTRSEVKHPVIRNLTSRFQHIASPSPAPPLLAEDFSCRPPISHAGVSAVLRQLHNPCELSSSVQGHLGWVDETSNALALTVDSHECPECGKRYSTSSNLARHRQTHRSVTDKKARKCPHCEKVYVSMPAYSMHVRTHSQGCQCPYCGKCFSRPWLLQGHIRTHTGEKPFKCPVCNKAFADKSNLRAHIQTHSTTKPYVCQRCGKAFALKSYLYKHEESSCMRLHRQQRAIPRPLPSDDQAFQIQA